MKKEVRKTTWKKFLKEIDFTTKNFNSDEIIYIGRWHGYESTLKIRRASLIENFEERDEIIKFITKTIAKDLMKKINGEFSQNVNNF